MAPSYVPEDDCQEAASYRAVLDAVVENSSAHGLPTFYKAKGNAVYQCCLSKLGSSGNYTRTSFSKPAYYFNLQLTSKYSSASRYFVIDWRAGWLAG